MGQGHEPGPLRGRRAAAIAGFVVAGSDPRLAEAPLATLLSWAWVAMTIEVDNAVEAEMSAREVGRLFRISLAAWANGMRLIDEDGITVADARARAGAATNIPGLERWGWIHIGDEPSGERRAGYGSAKGVQPGTVLRPTRAGSYARRLWPEKVAEVEAAWKLRFGAKVVGALDTALSATGLVRPWGPPQVNPSDGFRSHVLSGEGTDRETTARTAGSGPSSDGPPLAARLGAVLTAVTLEVEAETSASVPLAANFLRVLEPGPLPIKDLPVAAGVSKEAVAMATGYLRRHRLGTEAERRMQLTPKGRSALEQYRSGSGGREWEGASPLRRALVDLLAQGEALAAGLHPAEGCWRAQKPYRAQTDRILADPLAALPRQPMVLHRGGWPDGA